MLYVWEFFEQRELLWSYTDKGLPKEVKRESGIPTSSCGDYNGVHVISSAKEEQEGFIWIVRHRELLIDLHEQPPIKWEDRRKPCEYIARARD